MKMFRKLVSVVAAATLLTSSMALTLPASAAEIGDTQEAVASEPNLQSEVKDGVILHAFNWSYNSIKDNLPAIAAAGYTTVQTSPVQQPKDYGLSTDVANQWWKLYQPVSMSIAQKSWLGTKADLTALCAEADKYGIKIIVDIVSNHMANYVDASGKENANKLSEEVKTYLPTFYNNYSTYFHTETFDARDDSATYVTRGHVSACPDLNTANTAVQNEVIKLLKECIDCGVDGFRFDAAKHIETDADGNVASQYWNNVLGAAKSYYNGNLFNYGEILNTVGNGRSYSAYTKNMSVTDNKFGDTVLYQVAKAHSASGAISTNYVTGDATKSVLWAESHDTYMGSSGAGGISNTATVDNTDIVKAWAIVAARKGATALYFARPGSAIMGQASTDTTYKSTAVSEVNKFHNAFAKVNSEKVGASGSIAYVARGDSGIVLVNVSGTTASVNVANTGLANGSYVDTITGNTFTVSNGTVSGNIGSTGVAVVYHSTATPKALASVETGSFEGETMTVKLSLENAVSGTYALEDSAPATFTGTPTIRIGSDYAYGETIHLNLTATDASGQTTKSTYSYTKNKGADSGVYVFINPKNLLASWQTPYKFYIYDENTTTGDVYYNEAWSGKVAEYDPGSGYYYVEVPTRCYYKNTKTNSDPVMVDYDLAHSNTTQVIVIATYNSNELQYPSKDGLKLGGTSHIFSETVRNGWTTTTLKPTPATVQATDVTKGDQQQTTTAPPATTQPQPVVPEGIYGDVDGNGKVTIDDATAIQKYLAEYTVTPFIEKSADVDGDGKITIFDVTYIQKFLAGFGDYKRTNEPYGGNVPPVTEPPVTEPPVTDPPATDPPATTPVNPNPPVGNYYLVGYFNGADYYGRDYKFDAKGNVTVTFAEDSYVIVQNDAGKTYMTDGWAGYVDSTTLYDVDTINNMTADKLYVPAGTFTFMLTDNSDGTFTLSYVAGGSSGPVDPTPTTPVNPNPPVGNYYLVGYFNGQDYYGRDYKFNSNGNVTVTFSEDSYVIVQNDAGKTYMTDGWAGYVDSTTLYDVDTINNMTADKLYVPAGTSTFTLSDNGDGTFTLSYVAGGSSGPVDPNPGNNTVTLNAAAVTTGEEVWYAWTWDTGSEGSWVYGGKGSTVTFTGLKGNVTFARVNPDKGEPNWDDSESVWNQTEDLVTQAGGTYTITGWGDGYGAKLPGSWSGGSVTPNPTNPNAPSGNYYLVGYFNGADYYGRDYKFNNGQVTVTFSEDSYVIVQDDNGKTYMTDGWAGYVDSTTLYDVDTINNMTADKLYVPAGTATFTLSANGDGTLTLSYTTGGSVNPGPGPVDPTPGGNTVTLSAAAVTTGDEVWYAWTWDTGSEGSWVYGGTGSTITFTGIKGNVVFARINPAKGEPNWDDKESVWNQTDDLVTQAGGTYTINSWGTDKMQGSWSGGGSTTDPTPNPPSGNSVTLNAAATTTGDEIWYAWTWDTGSEGTWVYGGKGSTVTFTGLKGNVTFARVNPAKGEPNWNTPESVWNQTEDLVTQQGGTYTITGWGNGYGAKLTGTW